MGLFDRFKKKDHDDENIDESVKNSASTGEESTGEDIRSVDEGEKSTEEIPVSQTAEEADDQEKSDVQKEADDQNDDDTQTEEIPEEHKQGFFKRLVAGLTKTRNQLTESLNQIFKGHSELDDDFYDELEEVLIMADLGLETTDKIIDDLKVRVKQYKIKEVEPCRELLNNIIRDQMMVDDSAYDFEDQKTVMLIIGVNGVGKTTSIGKLAAQYKNRGKKVLMAAGDTFRAAAIDQLKTWAERAGVEIIAQQEGSDPAAVVYDAVQAAKARNVDILLCDTAGRLHNKKNLMDELAKMRRIIEKEYPEAHLETLIVLDGSTGQNALEQARQFREVTDLNGIILTKLDGTAKGGIAIAIQSELDVPVKYIGVGEKINDLQRFDPNRYVEALFADFEVKSDVEMLIEEEDE
ncbi:MAG: signal recognition particle-docking protein FtsY [Lachnospiraceae bacterium]|nr:signal recognition particle-docking protein FtsY [Lachnospiraceae bacterium]